MEKNGRGREAVKGKSDKKMDKGQTGRKEEMREDVVRDVG